MVGQSLIEKLPLQTWNCAKEQSLRVVGLGRVELPTNGLGKQIALLMGYENFGLYYIRQQVPMTTI